MKINLKSNYLLLGFMNINSINLDRTEITLKDLVQTISNRSTTSENLEYLNSDGTEMQPIFEVLINGRALPLYEDGINTVLRDGDAVDLYLDLQYGG